MRALVDLVLGLVRGSVAGEDRQGKVVRQTWKVRQQLGITNFIYLLFLLFILIYSLVQDTYSSSSLAEGMQIS